MSYPSPLYLPSSDGRSSSLWPVEVAAQSTDAVSQLATYSQKHLADLAAFLPPAPGQSVQAGLQPTPFAAGQALATGYVSSLPAKPPAPPHADDLELLSSCITLSLAEATGTYPQHRQLAPAWQLSQGAALQPSLGTPPQYITMPSDPWPSDHTRAGVTTADTIRRTGFSNPSLFSPSPTTTLPYSDAYSGVGSPYTPCSSSTTPGTPSSLLPLVEDSVPQQSDAPQYQPRNTQVFYCRRTPTEWKMPGAFKCRWCDFVQTSRRKPDLERHEKKHFKIKDYTCVGLPIYWAPAESNVRAGFAYYGASGLVGGCGKKYSRRDSYRKHLRKTKKGCCGDPNGPWHWVNVA
ncbi:hypothetical protein C8T65DRAFT_694675 [Cerioporus squamosus]|nr:hypothetical protein C8T65DRAFT_694675 [Cerioporus squamosus]